MNDKMKQTAVDWLFAELKNHLDMPSHHANEILEQAKEMERLKISETYAEASINAIQGLIDEHNDNLNEK
jgi:hypothetical protein